MASPNGAIDFAGDDKTAEEIVAEKALGVGDIFGSGIVKLVVGSEKKVFYAHQAMLCRLPSSKRIFTPDINCEFQRVEWPDLDPRAVRVLLYYLYNDEVDYKDGHPKDHTDKDRIVTLALSYVLAHRYDIDQYADYLMDNFQDLIENNIKDQILLSRLDHILPNPCTMRSFLVEQIVESLQSDANKGSEDRCDANMSSWIRKGGELVLSVTKELAKGSNDT